MGKRSRGAVLAAAGLMAAAAPFVVGQDIAGATEYQDYKTGQLTFVGYNRQTVTCTVSNSSRHDTSTHTATTFGSSACSTDALFVVTITAKDEGGRTRTSRAEAYSSAYLYVDHASSGVKTTVEAYFNGRDPGARASCYLAVAASPK